MESGADFKSQQIQSLWSDDFRERVRALAACAIYGFSDTQVVDRIMELLADPYPPVRVSATTAIRSLELLRAIPAVLQNLEHPNPSVRTISCSCLATLVDTSKTNTIASLR